MDKTLEMRVEELEQMLFISKNVLSFDEASKFLNLSKSYLYKLTSGLSMLVSLLRQGIFLIPLLYIMNYFFHVTGNVCAHVAADLMAVVVAIVLTVRQYRKLQKTLQPNQIKEGHSA